MRWTGAVDDPDAGRDADLGGLWGDRHELPRRMARSNFVGACTGKSAGLSPLGADQGPAIMGLDQGFAWNGTTYRSLTEVAVAMTGTRWSGPRFFGLRDRPKRSA